MVHGRRGTREWGVELPDGLAAEAGNPGDEMLRLRGRHERTVGIGDLGRAGAGSERLLVLTMSSRDAWEHDS